MVCTPHKGRCMNGVRFICDDTVRVEVPDIVHRLCFVSVLPLDLPVLVEDVHIFLAHFFYSILW